MAIDRRTSSNWIEWALLVLGLPGVAALFIEFAWGTSPVGAYFIVLAPFDPGSFDTAHDRVYAIVRSSALLAFFLAPFVSLAQLSRCFGRPLSRFERRALGAVALLTIGGNIVSALVGCHERLVSPLHEYGRAGLFAVTALAAVIGMATLSMRVRAHRSRDAAESLAMGAYIVAIATWALGLIDMLEPGAIVFGWTCLVYAASCWRRNGITRAEGG
jgi:hypothetical protein